MIVDGIQIKTIPGFPNYAISKDGRVWSKPRKGSSIYGMWLKPSVDEKGYMRVKLHQIREFSRRVHRLLLETYVGPCPTGMECRHLNGNPADNRLANLCWGTPQENQQDRFLHGTDSRGENCGGVKLIEPQVRIIFHAYHDGIATQQELADHFEIAKTTIGQIVRKKTWKHLWGKVA